MKALVTGGAGFIGSHIVDELISMGHQVVVIDNESSDAHDQFYWNPNAEQHKIDICNFDLIRPWFDNVDWVFHLAAESRIQPAILNPTYATEVNVVGTCNVLQCAREAGVKRLVYSSTSAAYGLKNTPPLNEDMPRDCLNAYSITKCAGEDLVKMYYQLYGMETVCLRYFNVYGDRQPIKGQYAPVIGLFMRQQAANEPMTIVGDGKQRRDFTHVSDVVAANIAAATCKHSECLGEVFNVGTGQNYSILELVEIMGGEYTFIGNRPAEAQISLANNTKAQKILNWSPQVKLEEWLNNA
jgi:UDP-glucose 4-epimerase|tara:strand:- start:418 stop:1311 length:894 start_codon:yes stop_codon:yes gene_type:complete